MTGERGCSFESGASLAAWTKLLKAAREKSGGGEAEDGGE